MRTRALAAALAAFALVAIALVSTATAGRPSFNPVCLGTKIEGGTSGVFEMTYGPEVGSITIVVEDTELGPVFSFDTGDPDHVVGQVDVKGGTSITSYVFPDEGVTNAGGLHAAVNPSSGLWYGISYLCFHTASLGGEEEEGGGGAE
jgi:hypothetical protein